jgi:hypothetical protein
LAQGGNGGFHAEPYAFLVNADDGVPFLFAGFQDAFDVQDAGVVDQDVEAAEFAGGGIDGGPLIGASGDVKANRYGGLVTGLAIDLLGEGSGVLIEYITDDNAGTLVNEDPCLGSALPARTAGNQCNFALKPIHVSPL